MTPPTRTSPRGLLLKGAVGLAVTTVLVVFLFRYIDLGQLGELFARTRWSLWLVAFSLWVLIYLGRAQRFILLAPRTPFLTMLCITALHNFFLRLLPFRTGELSYAFLVKRVGTAGLGEGLLGIVLLRIIDGIAVLVIFAAALAFHQGTYLGDRRLGVTAAVVAALLGGVVVACLTPLLRLGLRLGRALLAHLGLLRRQRVARALEHIEEAVTTFSRIRTPALLGITGISLMLWLLTFGVFFAMMRAFYMPVGVAQTVLGSTASVVTGFLPIGGIGSFGTLEAGWALGFVLVGLDRTQAVASGFGVSITTFAYSILLGLLGWIGLALISKRQHPRE